MEITSIKLQSNGYLVNGTTSVPNNHSGWMSEFIEEWLETNIPEPEFTEIELANKAEKTLQQEASKLREVNMLTGFTYNGTQISVTSEDGNGLLQVKSSFELGLTETVIHFKNGSKLPITATEFPEFALAFATERAKYFI